MSWTEKSRPGGERSGPSRTTFDDTSSLPDLTAAGVAVHAVDDLRIGCTQCLAWHRAGWLRGAADGHLTGRDHLITEQLDAQAERAQMDPFNAEGVIRATRARRAREQGWRAEA